MALLKEKNRFDVLMGKWYGAAFEVDCVPPSSWNRHDFFKISHPLRGVALGVSPLHDVVQSSLGTVWKSRGWCSIEPVRHQSTHASSRQSKSIEMMEIPFTVNFKI